MKDPNQGLSSAAIKGVGREMGLIDDAKSGKAGELRDGGTDSGVIIGGNKTIDLSNATLAVASGGVSGEQTQNANTVKIEGTTTQKADNIKIEGQSKEGSEGSGKEKIIKEKETVKEVEKEKVVEGKQEKVRVESMDSKQNSQGNIKIEGSNKDNINTVKIDGGDIRLQGNSGSSTNGNVVQQIINQKNTIEGDKIINSKSVSNDNSKTENVTNNNQNDTHVVKEGNTTNQEVNNVQNIKQGDIHEGNKVTNIKEGDIQIDNSYTSTTKNTIDGGGSGKTKGIENKEPNERKQLGNSDADNNK